MLREKTSNLVEKKWFELHIFLTYFHQKYRYYFTQLFRVFHPFRISNEVNEKKEIFSTKWESQMCWIHSTQYKINDKRKMRMNMQWFTLITFSFLLFYLQCLQSCHLFCVPPILLVTPFTTSFIVCVRGQIKFHREILNHNSNDKRCNVYISNIRNYSLNQNQ